MQSTGAGRAKRSSAPSAQATGAGRKRSSVPSAPGQVAGRGTSGMRPSYLQYHRTIVFVPDDDDDDDDGDFGTWPDIT